MIRILSCGCVETQTSIQTCPVCLPVGAIEFMIENGRQLELFEDGGVTLAVSGLEAERSLQDLNDLPEGDLPF